MIYVLSVSASKITLNYRATCEESILIIQLRDNESFIQKVEVGLGESGWIQDRV